MPSTAQHEATIPVEVLVIQSDANGLFHKTIHVAQCSVQNDGVAEVDAMPCNTIILDRTLSYMDLLVKEAIDIRLNNQNFNRDGGLMLRRVWHPVINMLSSQKARLMQQILDTNRQLPLARAPT
jgi:hypothetical protein